MYTGFHADSDRSRSRSRSGNPANSRSQPADGLVGRSVRINRGDADSVEGTLIASPSDYLVLESSDGVVYVNGQHVNSMTEGDRSSRSVGRTSYIRAPSFQSALARMRHKFIRINGGGTETIDGFLVEANSDSLLLIVGRRFSRVPMRRIKTVVVTGDLSDGHKSGTKKRVKSGGRRSGQRKEAPPRR